MPVPLTSEYLIATRREMAQRFLDALDLAERNGGPAGRMCNTSVVFDNLFTAGIVLWRSGATPAPDFRRALEAVDAALEYLARQPQPFESFLVVPIQLAAIASFLLSGEIPQRYLDSLPRPAALLRRHRHLQDLSYGILLVWALATRSIPPEALPIAELPRAKRARLSQDTFHAHVKLFQDVLRGSVSSESIALAESLYVSRRRSGYFEGGADYWGGGPMNPFALDFETAAILRLAQDHGLEVPPTTHCWRWAA